MKRFIRLQRPVGGKTASLLLAIAASQLGIARAADVYWDTNGATVGAATSGTANGTWNAATASNWTTDISGTIATMNYDAATGSDPANADIFFSAGTDATASVNLTLQGAIVAHSITIRQLMNITAANTTPSLTIGGGGVTLADTMVGPSTWSNSLPVTLSASQAWNNNSGSLFSVAGSITGAAGSATILSLSGTGAGGVTLSGAIANGASGTTAVAVNTTGGGVTTLSNSTNTFSGGITLNQGILRGQNGGATGTALGSGAITLAGGELQLARASNSNATAFTNAVVVTGNSQVTSIRNSSNGGVNHSLGSLSIGSQTLTIAGDPLTVSGTSGITFGATTLTGNSTFDVVDGAVAVTRLTLGALGGTGSFTKIGNGTLGLGTAAAGFSGDTFIHSGTVAVTNISALGTGTIHLGASASNASSTLSVVIGNSTLNNNIEVTANSGSGVATLANPATSTNQNAILGGTVALNDDLNIATTAGGGSLTFGNAIFSPVSGVATITHSGAGSVTFNTSSTIGANINLVQNAGSMAISGTNTNFNGSVTINGGGVTASASSFGAGTTVVAISSSGTFTNNQGNNTPLVIAGLTDVGGGGGIVNQNAGNRFISLAGSGTYAFSGTIIQGGINKTGTGTQILSGSNTYTNTTTVSAGTLLVTGYLTSGTVNVNGGVLGGTGTFAGVVNINSGGTVSAGTSPGTMTVNNTLHLFDGSTAVFEGGDLVDVNGTLDLDSEWTLSLGTGFVDGGSVVLFTFDTLAVSPDITPTFDTTNLGFTPSGPLSLSIDGNNIVLNGISAVPEPSAVLLAGAGLALMLFRVRRNVRP